jgi:MarR family transcriptional regulator, organic hydroperoxide resistance regulator
MSIEIHGPETARAEAAARAGDSAPAGDAAHADDSAPALNRDILEALTTLIKRAEPVWHSLATSFQLAGPDLLAMFKMEGGLAMKDLAARMGCDASFITTIADNLEKRGFVRREPSQRDRRVKNLVITEAGAAAKERLLAQVANRMPWCYALNDEERRCFLTMLQKMLDTQRPEADEPGQPAGADR